MGFRCGLWKGSGSSRIIIKLLFKEDKIERIMCITSASSMCPIFFSVLEQVGFPKIKENEDPLGYVLYPTGICVVSEILYCQRICFSFSVKKKSHPWSLRVKLSKGKFVLCPPILCLALVSTIIFLLLHFKWGEICKQQGKHKHKIFHYICVLWTVNWNQINSRLIFCLTD